MAEYKMNSSLNMEQLRFMKELADIQEKYCPSVMRRYYSSRTTPWLYRREYGLLSGISDTKNLERAVEAFTKRCERVKEQAEKHYQKALESDDYLEEIA